MKKRFPLSTPTFFPSASSHRGMAQGLGREEEKAGGAEVYIAFSAGLLLFL